MQKKEIPSTSIQPEETPYNTPIRWEWVKLSEISERIHYGFTASADHSSTGVKLLRITDIQDNQVNWNTVPGCQINDKEIPKYELHQNDILIARTGGTIGKTFLVEEIPPRAAGCGTPAIINVDFEFSFKNVAIFNKPEVINSGYLYYYLLLKKSSFFEQLTKGGAQPFLSLGVLRNIPFPLPPLAEQHRVVARVDQHMSICNELEAGLRRSQADSERLMEAVVGKMLAG